MYFKIFKVNVKVNDARKTNKNVLKGLRIIWRGSNYVSLGS